MIKLTKGHRIGELQLRNALVVASCPATEDRERLLRCADAGAAAAILKSCHTTRSSPEGNGFRRFSGSERGLWGTSTVARELLHPEKACSILAAMRSCSDFPVIPSIAGFTLDSSEWIDTLRLLEPYNPPCVQLDLFYLEEDLSLPVTQNRLHQLILELSQNSNLFLLPKLNQEIRPGAAIAVFQNTGIAGWSLLDSIRTHLPMSPSSHPLDFPLFQFAEGLNSASLFGSWQLPLVCEYVFRLRAGSTIPILAGGGVQNVTDIIRLLSLGADAVQVATAVIREGPNWIRRTLAEMQNLGVDDISRSSAISGFTKARASINGRRCVCCAKCSEQLMCRAIENTANGPFVNPAKCEGCGFCLTICPTAAIFLHSA